MDALLRVLREAPARAWSAVFVIAVVAAAATWPASRSIVTLVSVFAVAVVVGAAVLTAVTWYRFRESTRR